MKEGLEEAVRILYKIKNAYKENRYKFVGDSKGKVIIDSKIRAMDYALISIEKRIDKLSGE